MLIRSRRAVLMVGSLLPGSRGVRYLRRLLTARGTEVIEGRRQWPDL